MRHALISSMRPVTVKSKAEAMRQAKNVPNMRYFKSEGRFVHMSGEGFTTNKEYAWFGLPSSFDKLSKAHPWILGHTWEKVKDK